MVCSDAALEYLEQSAYLTEYGIDILAASIQTHGEHSVERIGDKTGSTALRKPFVLVLEA